MTMEQRRSLIRFVMWTLGLAWGAVTFGTWPGTGDDLMDDAWWGRGFAVSLVVATFIGLAHGRDREMRWLLIPAVVPMAIAVGFSGLFFHDEDAGANMWLGGVFVTLLTWLPMWGLATLGGWFRRRILR